MVLKQKVGNRGSKNRSSWEPDDWGQGCAAEGMRKLGPQDHLGLSRKEKVNLQGEVGGSPGVLWTWRTPATDVKCPSGPAIPESEGELDLQIHEEFCLGLGLMVTNTQCGKFTGKEVGAGKRSRYIHAPFFSSHLCRGSTASQRSAPILPAPSPPCIPPLSIPVVWRDASFPGMDHTLLNVVKHYAFILSHQLVRSASDIPAFFMNMAQYLARDQTLIHKKYLSNHLNCPVPGVT